jgi:hypothetical protein
MVFIITQKAEDWLKKYRIGNFEQIWLQGLPSAVWFFQTRLTSGCKFPTLNYKRAGRIQSAERAVPTSSFYNLTNLLSSLTRADSGQVTKGASYV